MLLFRSKFRRLVHVALCFLGLVLARPLAVDANELVVVWLTDGRMLSGEVDSRTDDERLWLRSASATFVIATSASWENIRAANVGGRRITPEQLSAQVDQLRTPQPNVSNEPVAPQEPPADPATYISRSNLPGNASSRVAWLDVEVQLANWDADAALDGVEVRILPKNAFGNIVPASGQITARLLARKQGSIHNGDPLPQLGRWALQADTNDFGPYGAIYRLPFRAGGLTAMPAVEPHGLVEVSFHVSGQGRFASERAVYLRSNNPLVRDLQRAALDRDR